MKDTSKNGKPNVKISIVTDNTVLTLANRGDMTQTEMNLSVLRNPGWPGNAQSGNTNCGGRLSTVDLLFKVACLVKKR